MFKDKLNSLFLIFLASFLIGIFITNIVFSQTLYLLFFFYFLLFILLFIFKKNHIFVVLFGVGFFIGFLYSYFHNIKVSQNLFKINNLYSKQVFIYGQVDGLYKKQEFYNTYKIKILSINGNTNFAKYFLLRLPKNILLDEYQYITLNGQIDKVDNFSPNFNYKKFLLSKDIYFLVNRYTNLEFGPKGDLSSFRQFVIDFRQNLIDRIKSMYPEKEALFLAGILIGAREDLPKDMSNDFNNSGLTHLIAVSGFNITIIIVFLGFLFAFFPLYIRFFIISLFIVFFTFVVGDNPPVIRASIMGIIGYLILVSGRKRHSLTLLLLTACFMVLYEPYYINYDISFHLSFMAVVGLLYFQAFFSYIFGFLPKFFAIKESFILTMSAMSTTLPIMILNFGQFSLFAPIANMIVGGVIPFAMFFGTLSILGDLIHEKLGYFIGFITYFILKFVNEVASFFGNLKYSLILLDFGGYSIYIQIFYYMLLGFLVMYFKTKKNPN